METKLKVDYKELYKKLYPDTENKNPVCANEVKKTDWYYEVIEDLRNKLKYKDELIIMMVEDKYDSLASIDELSDQIKSHNKAENTLFKVKSELEQENRELKEVIDAFVQKYGFIDIIEANDETKIK